MPGGSYFLYTPSPNAADRPRADTFANAEEASQYLITEHSICTVPWDDAGAFLRFSVTYEAADEAAEDALMAELESRLQRAELKDVARTLRVAFTLRSLHTPCEVAGATTRDAIPKRPNEPGGRLQRRR